MNQEAIGRTLYGTTGSKLRKEYNKTVYCHPVYLTYTQSTSCEMLGWMLQAGVKTAGRNINNLRYADDTLILLNCGVEEDS